MLQKLDEVNVVQARVEIDNIRFRIGEWFPLNRDHVREFPQFDLNYVKTLTGAYHIQLSSSYIQDTVYREEQNNIQIDLSREGENFLRFRVFSRHRNSAKYMLWIVYNDDPENIEDSPIMGYYCTCKAGARTLGTCAHVASILWFLGYARHQANIKYPSARLLECIEGAENRLIEEDLNVGPELI